MVSTDRRATDPVLPVLLGGVAALALLGRPFFELFVGSDHPGLQAWATMFVAIVFQAVPFLVLGTLLSGRTVTFVGFVTPDGDARWYLTRIMITCCAADSRSYLVAVDGGGRPPVANTWQRVTGTWVASPPVDGRPTAWIAATAVTAVPAPAEPYELP